jgi:glycosyltransferase involved in cell wall biosynthesis
MKVVLANDVVYDYASGALSAVGGAERYQWLLARALAANGWSVVVGVRGALKAGERKTIDGVEFMGIGQGQILLAWYRFLAAERPDWWYWQCASHLWGPAVAIAKLRGVRTIFSAGVDRDMHLRHALFQHPRWWPLYAWGLWQSDRMFVQHGGQFSELAPRMRSKACILPGIVGRTGDPKPHSERAKYVVWVAMLRQVKRPDILIEIARMAPAIRFVVCGGPTTFASPPGYGERMIDALRAQPNMDYRGQIAPDRTLQAIADASILLSTSDEEGFPSTFLEAWAAGTPVVSLKIDPDHIIEQVGLGAVPGSIEKAVEDITVLMDSPQRRDEIGVRARRYVTENHSEVVVAEVFGRALQGVLR